ncbi:MAG: glucosidase [Verrucomicrobiales bacterium]|nr:glucosidase [Verrucomicrobiales bacterium]
MTAEQQRLDERDAHLLDWARWGSYLSDRQWGTVREDYSADGNAWAYFPHDHARSRAYRWGEDGLLGICDSTGRLCFAPAFWNGQDPFLKERAFGLSNPEGNHGEDVKDYFYHLENTPTHSYMRGLYKYPQAAFPYQDLIQTNARRSRAQPEYELVDTGIFQEGRYFDIFVEYAKASPEDLCIRLQVINRGPDPAPLWILPTLWFRNTWALGDPTEQRPQIDAPETNCLRAQSSPLGEMRLHLDGAPQLLFTENETNCQRLFGTANPTTHVKDAFHDFVIHGLTRAVNDSPSGTKAAAVYHAEIQPGGTFEIRLRLAAENIADPFGPTFQTILDQRRAECVEFYASITPDLPEATAQLQRQAFAGLLWCKKFYLYPVLRWLQGDPDQPPPPASRWQGPNAFWKELHANDIISMPDSWEYPYFCAWDLMFHAVTFSLIDPATAKRQNLLLHGERYTSPSAQTPAYEWALSDSNPPIQGWAAWRIFTIERRMTGTADRDFLVRAFNKLLMNYGWWANRVDQTGDNVFQGGFLGLDNIGIFDRRYPLPNGAHILQSDGTAWMATFCLHMLNIALELAREEPSYEDIADKFLNDFIHIAAAINLESREERPLWDEQDGFYYDLLKRPDGSMDYLKTRSIAGLIPVFAVECFNEANVRQFPLLRKRIAWFAHHRPELLLHLHHIGAEKHGKRLVSLVSPERLRRICARLFDEAEFLSAHGIRALSKSYEAHPYSFTEGGDTETVRYSPGDSPVAMFGGNSNWRGPVWMPMNFLLIEALQKFGYYFGDDFQVEFPTGSGQLMNLWEISLELQRRLLRLFERDPAGHRPFNGPVDLFQTDPHWRDLTVFNEYFHGDTGAGLGASHQTGWTALIAKMIRQLHTYSPA